jgi:glucose dehydrogenase
MRNNEPSIRRVSNVRMISGIAGFINGVWVIFVGTSYFYQFSPYSWILAAMLLVFPLRFIDRVEDFLYRSVIVLILAPLLGLL